MKKQKLYSYIVVSSAPIKIVSKKVGAYVAIELEEDKKLNLQDYWEEAIRLVLERSPK